MIYYTIIAMLICLTYLEWSGEDNNILGSPKLEKHCYVFMAALLTLVAALRYQSDPDWRAYTIGFEYSAFEWYNGYEIGFLFLCRTFNKLFHSYYVMQFVIAVFYGWVIFGYLYKKSDKPIFTLLLFIPMAFFSVIMNIQRQAIAIAIVILGMRFVEKRQVIWWLLSIVLAAQFHVTAICAIPLYYTTELNISKKLVLQLLVVVVAIELVGLPLVTAILRLTATFQWAPARVLEKMASYTASTKYGQQVQYGTGLGAIIRYLFALFIVLLYDNKKDKYILNFIIAFLCMAVGRNFDVLSRLHYYYTICGCGIVLYGLLDRISLPKWASVTCRCDVITCLWIISAYIIFTYLSWFVSFNYTVNQFGHTAKDYFVPYKTWILR